MKTINRLIYDSIVILLVTITLGSFSNCNKKAVLKEPDIILSYVTPFSSYSQKSEYRSDKANDYQLIPLTTLEQYNVGSDSMRMNYCSTIMDKAGQPSVRISFSKVFHKNQLEQLTTGQYVPKSGEDFLSAFNTGKAQIVSYDTSHRIREGIDFTYSSGEYYTFHKSDSFTPPVAAYLDTFNLFEVTNIESNMTFGVLSKLGLIPYTEFRAVMVTVNFKSKVYSTAAPNTPLILTNGLFQSCFVDR